MANAGPNSLGRALRGFLADDLPVTRGLSRHTILSYRDSLKLLLQFLSVRHGRSAPELDFPDLDPEHLLAFLAHLETNRGNCTSTRNVRLAAVHAFARYAAGRHPEHLELCQRILAVPFKRTEGRVVDYFDEQEMAALLPAPGRNTSVGRRDYALLLTLFNTGARVQELLDLRPCDLQLEPPHQALLHGKRRKQRICPLWEDTATALRELLHDSGRAETSTERLFRNRRDEPLTRHGVRYLLRKHAAAASSEAKTLATKRVHPHAMRHTAATYLLRSGVDTVTISHWLGHASIETTNRYLALDLEARREAVEKAGPLATACDPKLRGWKSDATILDWLEAL